jgi:hypothetical protein
MKKKTRPKKPSGTAGVTRISVGHNVARVERTAIVFPQNKEELEEFVVRSFERDIKDQPSAEAWFGEITRNDESDLDFDVAASSGRWKLELTEVVPTSHRMLTPEQSTAHSAYDRARAVLQQVIKKSKHYASVRPLKKILLLYATDWRFRLTEDELDLVRYWLAKEHHCFDYVYSYRFVSQQEGDARLVYPIEREWDDFDPERFRNLEITHLSPQGMRRENA